MRFAVVVLLYKSGPSTAQGLGPKTTDSSGNATWSWTVGTNTTTGSWPIEVRCGSVSAQTTFEVR
jgi:micrococcal nuclease